MLLSGSRTGFFKAAYFMGDGNDFAWGLVTMLPFALNLMFGQRWITTRLFGLGGFLAIAFATVGTQSRGATLAVGAAIFMFWLTISKRKLIGVAIIGVLVVGTVLVAPGAYIERMSGMADYQEDSSAQGRLRAWRAAVHMAIDYPLGVGANNFSRAYGRFYIPEDTSGYKAFRWISPHSVYFRVLGEYGFPGVALLFALLWANFAMNRQMALRVRGQPADYGIPPLWPALLNVGLVAYCVGGIFLGGFAYPHLFFMSGLTLACYRIMGATVPAAGLTQGAATPPAPTLGGRSWPPPAVSGWPAGRPLPPRRVS
jgi:probable O-glycosylation ligase (exosortase A-associated)